MSTNVMSFIQSYIQKKKDKKQEEGTSKEEQAKEKAKKETQGQEKQIEEQGKQFVESKQRIFGKGKRAQIMQMWNRKGFFSKNAFRILQGGEQQHKENEKMEKIATHTREHSGGIKKDNGEKELSNVDPSQEKQENSKQGITPQEKLLGNGKVVPVKNISSDKVGSLKSKSNSSVRKEGTYDGNQGQVVDKRQSSGTKSSSGKRDLIRDIFRENSNGNKERSSRVESTRENNEYTDMQDQRVENFGKQGKEQMDAEGDLKNNIQGISKEGDLSPRQDDTLKNGKKNGRFVLHLQVKTRKSKSATNSSQ